MNSFFLASRHSIARYVLIVAVMVAALGTHPAPAAALTPGANIVVNSAADTQADDGVCTLREAITAANTNTASGSTNGECVAGTLNLDKISFALTGGGPYTITPNLLPDITAPVLIDGTTQAGYSGTPQIILDGATAHTIFSFVAGSKGSKVSGFSIVHSSSEGIKIANTSGIHVYKNWIGTSDGTTAAANNIGINIINSSSNVIGGLDATGSARTNVISGNTGIGVLVTSGVNNFIQGNYIGSTASGFAPLGNGNGNDPGVEVGPGAVNTLIGGMKPNQGNVISGNTARGVLIDSGAKYTKIQRNFIGVGADGVAALGNNNVNIEDGGGVGTLIGGSMTLAGNIIAYSGHGIWVGSNNGSITIKGNLFGVAVDGTSAPGMTNGILFTGSQVNATIFGNLISGSAHGINFGPYQPKVAITQNCITGNVNAGVITTGGLELVKYNWWGASTGPNTAGADATSGSLTVAPWLASAPAACYGWAPRTFSPVNNTFRNKGPYATKFTWLGVGTAFDYQFTLSHNPDLSSPLESAATGGLKYYVDTLGALDYGAYYWQTITRTRDGVNWPSAVHVFYVTTMTFPKPATKVVPNSLSEITFKWLAYPGATGYIWRVYSNADCSGVGGSATMGPFTQYTTGAFPSGTYSWTLEPDNGPVMPCWTFYVP